MQCDICGGKEKRTSGALVAVCNCNKKNEDRGRMHPACLKAHMADLDARDLSGSGTQHCSSCPVCHTPYRLQPTHRFVLDMQHCCRGKSLTNAFECVLVATTLVCTVYAFSLIPAEELDREGQTMKWFLGVMSFGTLVLVVVTLKTVMGRWRRAASDLDFVESAV